MTLAFILLILLILSLLELCIGQPLPLKLRHLVAKMVIIGLMIGTSLLVVHQFTIWTIIIAFFSLYRCVNLIRFIQNRHTIGYLSNAVRLSSCWLIIYQAIVVVIAVISQRVSIPVHQWWSLLAGLQLIVVATLFGSTQRHLKTSFAVPTKTMHADRDLPTVSVLIPARNETNDLSDCLHSLVASTYPKLEILVLDDCSQNKRTPEIIRGFAHDGVQFIAGQVPPKQWLAKNFAYQQLSQAANGEVFLFCGVDARFGPDSIRELIETMFTRQKNMLSILPQNVLPPKWSLSTLIVQPCRYAWELCLPRRLFMRPPVLSTCWLISRTQFSAAGSFKAVTRSISPERYFATYTAKHSDGYSFLCSNQQLAVSSNKSVTEQHATAIRTRYPQLHKKLETTAIVSLAELSFLIGPFLLLLVSLLAGQWLSIILTLSSCLMIVSFYAQIVQLTYRRRLVSGSMVVVLAALYDIGLLNYSLFKYEFSDVVWKERNICIPVMRVIPRLPRLP